MLLRHPYLAEETEGSEATPAPAFDQEQMMALIKEGVKSTIKEVAESAPKLEPRVEPKPSESEANPFSQWIDPLVNPKLAAATLQAQAAEDKVDFYSSEQWLTELDELLPGDTEAEIKAAKAEIRKRLETTFTQMLNAGKGTFRREILDYEVGKYTRENKEKVAASHVKRNSAKSEAALEKARRGVDIGAGALSNFTPQSIHEMDTEKMLEQYGGVAF